MLPLKSYLIVGSTENWRIAFEHNPPIWGFTQGQKAPWESLTPGTSVYLYAAKEARGIIGKALVLNTIKGDDPYWPAEKTAGFAKWPLRFYFRPVQLLPQARWKAGKGPISSSEFGIAGINLQGKQSLVLTPEQVMKIEAKISSSWPELAIGSTLPEIARDALPVEYPVELDLHTKLIKMLEEMGSMQNFYPQLEFNIPNENRRIDVIWRRAMQGTPTYAFEVELSGGLDRSLNKLFRCRQLFNTEPKIVVPNSEFGKVKRIADGLSGDFGHVLTSIEPNQVEELYDRKKEFKTMESGIKIF